MRAVRALIDRIDASPEGDALGVVILFAALFGGLMLMGAF